MNVLHLDSSVLGPDSASRALTAAIVARVLRDAPNADVLHRDLAGAHALPHLDAASLAKSDPTEAARSARAMEEFLAADVVVLGAPMYNFGVASQLKAWIDRIAQAGRTFKYTDKGPVGLAGGKTVIVASSRGGVYSTSEVGQAMEHQESYLKVVFGFFGITDVRFVRAEGVGMGPDAKAQALANADRDIQAHLGTAANQPQVAAAA